MQVVLALWWQSVPMELRGKGWQRALGGTLQWSTSRCPMPGRMLFKGHWSTRDLPRGHLPKEWVR